jgi:DNA-binding CsgD family transcriptional regulator
MAELRGVRTLSLDDLVRDIYGSLSEHMSFNPSIEAVGSAFQSHITALHRVDLQAGRAWLEVALGLNTLEFSSFAEAYATRWAGQNLWVERGMPALLGRGYGTGDEVVSECELVRSEYYRHFLKPVDVHFGLGINVHNEAGSQLSIISFNRSKRAGPFEHDELLLAEQLRPHLVNAYSIYRRLVALQEAATSLRETFDHAPIGMLVLDANGHLVEQNAEASRLLATNTGISCAPNHALRLACPTARLKLKDALSRLGAAFPAPMPECIVIGKFGESGIGTLVLHLCAFPASVSQVMVREGRILGFLCELNRHSETQFAAQMLRVTLDLTPMEAAVVLSLRDHHDPMHVALELDLAISTVRSHLKHAFRKTGATRQSELLQLVDRVLSAAPS